MLLRAAVGRRGAEPTVPGHGAGGDVSDSSHGVAIVGRRLAGVIASNGLKRI
jgi:hypothetical protein